MAGRGPAPKDPSERARRNRDPISQTKLEFVRAAQPGLTAKMPDGSPWPAKTRAWWRRWKTDPRALRFDAATWEYLLDTAVIHGRLWSGDWKAAAELRLRLAGFGVTPGDRARLRVQLDDGLEGTDGDAGGESASSRGRQGARQRFGGLQVVGGTTIEA